MIGATPELLTELQTALARTSTDTTSAGSDSTTAVSTAVDAMQAAANQAQATIAQIMESLSSSVNASQGQLNASDWTGGNRATFDTHYSEFNVAMTTAGQNTNQTFTNLAATIRQINSDIEEYANTIVASMGSASDSAGSMATAVGAQRDNLIEAMGGMAIG